MAAEPLCGSLDDCISTPRLLSSQVNLEETEKTLWEKYQHQAQSDTQHLKELSEGQIKYGNKVMRFSKEKRGAPGPHGYPLYIALHGGGSAPPSLNDSQWNHMKIYYRDSVDNGIYVATRGVTDTWNLHFVNESYPLYDHLIADLIALENVDPNQVYLTGFSAGGDGVYQITPRMTDRWAAANMSAGHNNWIRFDNLYNLPLLLQVGANDGAYSRNHNAVENHFQISKLQSERGGYLHEMYLHDRGSHNSWRDNDAKGGLQTIVTNLADWLKGASATTTQANTNAVHWMKKYARQPYPSQLYWDYEVNAPRDFIAGKSYVTSSNQELLTPPKNLFYWLSILEGDQTQANPIHATIDPSENKITLSQLDRVSHLRILLRTDMIDFNKPIQVVVDTNEVAKVTLQPNLQTMTRTLLERGDRSYIFHADIELKKTGSVWHGVQK